MASPPKPRTESRLAIRVIELIQNSGTTMAAGDLDSYA